VSLAEELGNDRNSAAYELQKTLAAAERLTGLSGGSRIS
jgi:hypothetical protein